MPKEFRISLDGVRRAAAPAFRNQTAMTGTLACLAALALVGYWMHPLAMLAIIPIASLILVQMRPISAIGILARGNDRCGQAEMCEVLDAALVLCSRTYLKTGCLVLRIDQFDKLREEHDESTLTALASAMKERLRGLLRDDDRIFDLKSGRVGIVLAPVPSISHEAVLHLGNRLLSSIERPLDPGASPFGISASLGYCIDTNAPTRSSKAMLIAALGALEEALRHGPAAVCGHGEKRRLRRRGSDQIVGALLCALDNGEVTSWFQPQLSTENGHVSGFEALARWIHPEAGLITPAEFLPLLAVSGRLEILGQVMLSNALGAVRTWDSLGLHVPHVGVNFSPEELRNPQLARQVEWELDRNDIPPQRLAVEILETVVATSPEVAIVQNIGALSEMGCLIDLDDFGTGHASLASLRRFAVHRIKIDRSFVHRVDRDLEQQRMLSAILSMAERLELDTLAEGVETAGEHAILAQLGCGHVQGFGIARPMPLHQTPDWIARHLERLGKPLKIGNTAR